MESNTNPSVKIIEEEPTNYDLTFKIVVIGNPSVGKSCIAIKATKDTFDENSPTTIGFEYVTFSVEINKQIVHLQIWDTCGQEVYRSLISNFYRNASLAVIVYAINEYKT